MPSIKRFQHAARDQATAVVVSSLALFLLTGSVAAADSPPKKNAPAEAAETRSAETRSAETRAIALEGLVTGSQLPLRAALVYAYDLGEQRFVKALTDDAGRFLFSTLPAGLYKVIAFKEGFIPAVEVLRRWRDEGIQQLDLALAPVEDGDARQAESFWDVRSRVPGDVLRDVSGVFDGEMLASEQSLDASGVDTGSFETRLIGAGGSADVPDGYRGTLTGADVGVRGEVGGIGVGIEGSYQQIQPREGAVGDAMAAASRHAVSVSVQAPKDHSVRLSTAAGEMATVGDGTMQPADLEHHHVQWSGPSGAAGKVDVSASLTEESNYFQPGWADFAAIPSSSRLLDVAGHYSRDLGERATLEAGVRYREHTSDPRAGGAAVGDQSLDIFGAAGARIQPRVLVEVGLFSKVRDGSLSLMPQGTFVIDLGNDWKARASVAQRFERAEDGALLAPTFYTAHYADRSACQSVGDACYEVFFSRGDSDTGNQQFSIGALHRKYAETLRLTFSRDFFDRLESLFLVRGDELPEVQVQWARRVAPKILARLQSNYAEGGGGLVYASDQQSYENDIRYLVASVDTQFERTSTGVFVAFHHLEQALNPAAHSSADAPASELELERLQLMLTQDLDILDSLPSNWAVRLNMEVSRGATPYTLEPDKLMRTLTGGIAVSF